MATDAEEREIWFKMNSLRNFSILLHEHDYLSPRKKNFNQSPRKINVLGTVHPVFFAVTFFSRFSRVAFCPGKYHDREIRDFER